MTLSAQFVEPERALDFDPYWRAALEALRQRVGPDDTVFGPNEFLHHFPRLFPIHIRRRMIPEERIDWFLLHKGMRDRVDPEIAQEMLHLPAHFANEVFILFGRREGKLPEEQAIHVARRFSAPSPAADGHAALVKTFDRPQFLERSLASLAPQFDRVLVVDDGSGSAAMTRNEAAAKAAGASYIRLGQNLGAACVFNVGLSVLLADLDMAWISTFDDDVELAPGSVQRLRQLTGALGERGRLNFYSGYQSPLHLVHGEKVVSGEKLHLCRSCSGQHMHAHRSYWQAVMPVPTTYARAPKPAGGLFEGHGDDTDWWFSNWAPQSAMKRGGAVYVLPGLVSTFGESSSTWYAPAR